MSLDLLTRQVLSELTSISIRWALLHSPPDDLGSLSDCDIAADSSGPEIVLRLRGHWERTGLHPIVHSYYDVGRGDAVWIWSEPEQAMLHLDVLSDPTGLGRLGIRTDLVLATTSSTRELAVADEAWRGVYRVSKDLARGRSHPGRLEALAGSAAAASVFGARPWPAWVMERGLTRENKMARAYLRARIMIARLRRNGPVRLMGAQVGRRLSRATRRAGRWIHVSGPLAESASSLLEEVLGDSLPVHRVGAGAGRRFLPIEAKVRTIRPQVFITWTDKVGVRPAPPDAFVDAGTEPIDAGALVADVMRQLATVTYRRMS